MNLNWEILNWNWEILNWNWEILNWNLEILNWNWEILNWKFPTKKLNPKINYHFYNVNNYMWCYQYTGTIMIQMVWFGFVVPGESPGCLLISTASMLEWLRNSSPTTHRGAVWKDGAEIPWGWSLPECFTSSGGL